VLLRIARRLEGVQLVVTGSGREGRELASSLSPHLIVLDTQLTDGAVHDLLVHLVRRAGSAASALVVLSGSASERIRLIQGGAAAGLTKPLNIAEVERTMSLLLDR
jgi:DNA-binding response OmpR family regulator